MARCKLISCFPALFAHVKEFASVPYHNPSLKYIMSDGFLIHERLAGQQYCISECWRCIYWKAQYFQPSFASHPTFSLISPSFVFSDQGNHFLNAVPHLLLQAVSKRHWHPMSCETTPKTQSQSLRNWMFAAFWPHSK